MSENALDNTRVELIGEDGQATYFIHLMTLEYKGKEYTVLHPEEVEDESQVLIFAVTDDEAGGEAFELVEDDALSDEVLQEFILILEQEDEQSE